MSRVRPAAVARLVAASALGLGVACNALTGVGDLTLCDRDRCDVADGGADSAVDDAMGGDGGALDGSGADTSTEGPGGTLDLTFGTGGITEASFPDPRAVAVRADGRIVVAGALQNELAALAFTSAGVVDATFGTSGRVVKGMGTSSAGNAVAFDSEGRAVIGGVSIVVTTASTRYAYVARIGDTTVDTTFGTGGSWRGDAAEEVRGVVVTPADGIVLSASEGLAHTFWRLGAAGSPDVAFGTGGKTMVPAVGGVPAGLVALPDGFVSAGTGDAFAGRSLVAVKVSLAGAPGGGFGDGGKATSKVGPDGSELGRAIAAQPDGKVVLAGDYTPSSADVKRVSATTRFTASGKVDTTYGAGGSVVIDLADLAVGRETETFSVAIATDAKGRALVVGTVRDKLVSGGERARAWVVRLRDDGSLDPLFGSQGRLFIGSAQARLDVRGAALQPDGKLVIVGVNENGGALFLARIVTSTTK